ncbi:cupredoxin domain-containing protein, partial [Ilumatobacter sp.]|uniref:cupredoxin domain-containing protein n=1 Tax=Ilumatobacter sp. TaxID=1967498 RepID=UPI003C678829
GPGFGFESGAAAATYEFTIPAGAGEALDAGEPLEILPATLDVNVGETIEIVNLDDRGHNVGPWFVGADETIRQEFTSPGSFEGVCTVHPSGELVLNVSA